MAKYVDGFVLVVPDSKVAEYTKMAENHLNSQNWQIQSLVKLSGFLLSCLNQKSIETK